MERIWKIDVHGVDGYSFAVKGDIGSDSEAIEAATIAELFDSPYDAGYAYAEEITDSQYDIDGLAGCTFDV